jgi:hypothetical protein
VSGYPDGAIGAPRAVYGRSEALTLGASYCHGYCTPDEHFHYTFEDLLDCALLGDEPHLQHDRWERTRRQVAGGYREH